MSDKFDSKSTRRRFLQVGVPTTAAITFAGCLGDDDDEEPIDQTDDTDDIDDTADGDDDDDAVDDDDDDDEVEPGLDSITITQGEFPTVEDPNDHITGPYFNVFDHVYEPLFNVTPGEEPEPRVVTGWEHMGDGIAELTIRDDVLFHGGQALVADDIAFTLQRQIDPETPPVSDQVAGLGSIAGAEADGDHTLLLEYTGAPQLAEFEFGNYLRAISREWFENEAPTDEGEIVGDDADAFNGTGPLQVVDYDRANNTITLEPFDDYWGDVPDFDQVTFTGETSDSGRVSSIIAGETDLIDNVLPGDVGDVSEDSDVRNITSFRNIFLVMKNEFEPFDSLEFRQAMNYAVDNQEIINELLGGFGEPMSQPVPEGINGYNPDLEPYERDLDLAEQLVEDSGHAGVDITLYGPEGRYLNDADITRRAADQIDDLPNVNCDASVEPFETISGAAAGGFDDDEIKFFLIGWGVITGDTDYGVSGFMVEDAALQNFRDDELNTAIIESKGIDDPAEREQALMDINAMAREKAPWVFLHLQESIYGVNPALDWEPRRDESVYVWDME